MMTIDELIQAAQENVALAIKTISISESNGYAAIAQAAALTAQVMMQYEQWQEYNRAASENSYIDQREYVTRQ